jgi:ABC-type uncharacterized transport system involved in gliding motility auxiliary subunit
MKNDLSRFAPIGLVFSGLAVLAFVIILVIQALSSAGIFQLPDPLIVERGLWISLSCFVLGLAVAVFLAPEQTRKFLFGRQAKYGSNALLMLLAFLGILFFLNLLAYQNPKSWDLTENQKNTLAPETVNLLKSAPQPVAVRAYYSTQIDSSGAKKLLESFKQAGGSQFSFEFIDPEANPVAAKQDGIDRDGTLIVETAGNKEQVTFPDEEGLASAIVRLMNPKSLTLYFLTGHGEADTEQAGDTSYTLIKRALENKNYQVKSLNLGQEGKVPTEASTVILAGLKQPIPVNEVKLLEDYLAQGGALIIMEDPAALTKFAGAPDTLTDLLGRWGITLGNDILVDPGANPPLLVYADPLNYGQHPITAKMRGLNSTFFTARSLQVGQASEGIQVTPLAQTYPNAWGETDFQSIQDNKIAFDQTKDIAGPLILAAAGENGASQGRLVVFGDYEFAADALYKRGNGTILLNAIDWTARRESAISLTPKNNTLRTFNPPGTLGLVGAILASICLIPALIVAGGVAAWVSRRRRG